jgi:hypothetical protein
VVVVRPAGKGNEKGEENSDQCGTSEVFTECGVKGSHSCEWELGMGGGCWMGARMFRRAPCPALDCRGRQGRQGRQGSQDMCTQ